MSALWLMFGFTFPSQGIVPVSMMEFTGTSSYIIKEIEKLVSCRYGVTMPSGNVARILEKRVKHSAAPRVLHASLHSPNIPLVHYHTITERDSFSISKYRGRLYER